MSADDDIPKDDSVSPESQDGAPAPSDEAAVDAPPPEGGSDDVPAEEPADDAGEAGTEAEAAPDGEAADPGEVAESVDPVTNDSAGDDAAPAAEAEPEATAFRYDEKYYAPVSPDAPAGAEVPFYHFAEMDQDLAWPQNEFGRPDPAQRPNFRSVRDQARTFMDGTKEIKATRDVRSMLALVTAEAGDSGPVGLAKALDLFVATATSMWDAIHPQKEDEDDDELMTRMEEMRKYMNPQVILMAVDSVALAKSPRVGVLTTRTFGIAATKVNAREGEFSPNPDALKALFAEEEDAVEGVKEAHAAYQHAIDRLRAMEAFLEDHPDVDPVDLASVADGLQNFVGYLAPYVGGAEVSADEDDAEEGGPSGMAQSGPITGAKTFDEAMALIDNILGFYARSGRSSPVPLGLIALRDLIASDFNNWIAMTASGGLASAAINLSSVDASQLSQFASGDSPSASAPTAPAIDFSELDTRIYYVNEAIASLEHGLKNVELANPPAAEAAEGEEGAESVAFPWDYDMQALKDAVEAMQATRTALEPAADESADGSSGSDENGAKGDGDHSRITNRNDVKSSLDAVAAYFEREEPSSPAPAYLRRLRSLVDARFDEIARELMPEEGGEAKLQLEPRTKLR